MQHCEEAIGAIGCSPGCRLALHAVLCMMQAYAPGKGESRVFLLCYQQVRRRRGKGARSLVDPTMRPCGST